MVAVVAGILFAVHPLHTEAVSNTVGRAELLAMWAMLALLVYLPSTLLLEETAVAQARHWHGILVAACFFPAMLCKETPAPLLIGIVGIDIWPWARWPAVERPRLGRWLGSQSLRYYLPMAGMFSVTSGCGFAPAA